MQTSENKPMGFYFMLISEQDMDLAKSTEQSSGKLPFAFSPLT
jgi:hypothetical protein